MHGNYFVSFLLYNNFIASYINNTFFLDNSVTEYCISSDNPRQNVITCALKVINVRIDIPFDGEMFLSHVLNNALIELAKDWMCHNILLVHFLCTGKNAGGLNFEKI